LESICTSNNYNTIQYNTMHLQLMRKLSKPSKVASILDWKKASNHTVLAVNFHKNRVGIAIASHPSLGVPCLELEPLQFEDRNGNRKSIGGDIDRECLERFSDIIEDYKVCGVVINWPLQRDTGRMGAACGRVLFALEQLWERSNEKNTATTSTDAHDLRNNNNHNLERGGLLSRPFCLWDAGHIDLSDPSKKVDSFGRCASYGKENPSSDVTQTPTPASETRLQKQPLSSTDRYYNKEKNYFASKEQYHEDELTVVLGVWDDFCREHWPDIICATNNDVNFEVEEEGDDDENTDPRIRYSDLGPPITERPPRLQEMAKKKKSLIRMR